MDEHQCRMISLFYPYGYLIAFPWALHGPVNIRILASLISAGMHLELALDMKGVAPRCNFAIRILDRCVFSMTYSSSAFVTTNERVTLGRDHGSKIQTQHFGALTSIYPRIDKDWMPRTLK